MNADILPPQRTSTEPPVRDDRDVRLAWVCLAASPVAFVVAFVVGEGTSTVLGYDGTGIAPWWILLVTLVLALTVFCVPAALATWFWQRALARGDDRGKVPAVILITLSAGFLAMNLLALLVGMLMERV
jgi:hypothetical protein